MGVSVSFSSTEFGEKAMAKTPSRIPPFAHHTLTPVVQYTLDYRNGDATKPQNLIWHKPPKQLKLQLCKRCPMRMFPNCLSVSVFPSARVCVCVCVRRYRCGWDPVSVRCHCYINRDSNPENITLLTIMRLKNENSTESVSQDCFMNKYF